MNKQIIKTYIEKIIFDSALIAVIFYIGKNIKSIHWFINFIMGGFFIIWILISLLYLFTKHKDFFEEFEKNILRENKFYDYVDFVTFSCLICIFLYFDFRFLVVSGCVHHLLRFWVKTDIRKKKGRI